MRKQTLLLLLIPAVAALAADSKGTREFYRPYDPGSGKTISYTVKAGETLFDIADRLMGDPYQAQALAKRNNIKDPLHLEAGTKIEAPAPRLGIRYSIQRLVKTDNGYGVASAGDAKMGAGDRFQLWLSANCDGYLYIFNRDAKGDVKRVFPAGNRKTARVRRFSQYLVPREGWFRMDTAKGDEELWVLVSLDPLSDLEGDLIATGAKAESYFDGKRAAQGKGITIDSGDESDGSTVVEDPLESGVVLAHKIRIVRNDR